VLRTHEDLFRNNVNLIREWSSRPEIFNKSTYRVFPEQIETFTLFKSNLPRLPILNTFADHISSSEILKRIFTLFKALRVLRIKKSTVMGAGVIPPMPPILINAEFVTTYRRQNFVVPLEDIDST
jgi:hypothetical protein